MISAVYVLDIKGKVIISRNYRDDLAINPQALSDKFILHILENEQSDLNPVIYDDNVGYVYIRHNDIYLLGLTSKNTNVMLTMSFLYRFAQVLESYFKELNEESIRDNFIIAYELFDEMMDFGYPQSTDANILKEYIYVKEKHEFVAPPEALTKAVSWRKKGIKYNTNQIYVDVLEKINVLIATSGKVIKSEIIGAIKMNSLLSGMPELKLGLNDKLLREARRSKIKNVELDDIKFHQCVRLARFENDRTISFIPPDKEFDLMSYRLDTPPEAPPLFSLRAKTERKSSGIKYLVRIKSHFRKKNVANKVQIIVPVPDDADSPKFEVTKGTVEYKPEKEAFVWSIRQFSGKMDFRLKAYFGLPSVESDEETSKNSKPIRLSFEIPYFTVSGIQVKYLKIIEKNGYHALPYVRYVTVAGNYQVRVSK